MRSPPIRVVIPCTWPDLWSDIRTRPPGGDCFLWPFSVRGAAEHSLAAPPGRFATALALSPSTSTFSSYQYSCVPPDPAGLPVTYDAICWTPGIDVPDGARPATPRGRTCVRTKRPVARKFEHYGGPDRGPAPAVARTSAIAIRRSLTMRLTFLA